MAIRDKIKAKFGRSKTTGSGDSTPSGPSMNGYYTGRKDIEYYKPHEIPKSKYRGTVDKAHQESLEAYSFLDAFQTAGRRASAALSGTFSPGGTKALSAAPSAAHSRRPSWDSRAQSHLSSLSGPSAGDSEKSRDSNSTSNLSDDTLDNFHDGAGANSTVPTLRLDRQATVTEKSPASFNSPFTLEELDRAMTKATITSPRRVSVFA